MIAFFRRVVLHDFWLKLFCLALAVLTWLVLHFAAVEKQGGAPVVNLLPVQQRTFSGLPVLVVSSAEDVRSVRVNPKEVEVTVQGDAKTLRGLQDKDIRVLVDLTGIQAAHDLRKRIEVSTPAGVTHVRVDPVEVQVVFPPHG